MKEGQVYLKNTAHEEGKAAVTDCHVMKYAVKSIFSCSYYD